MFFASLSFGQDAVQKPNKDIRVGFGAIFFETLSSEFTIEADMSKRWFVSARFSTLFWIDNISLYAFRRGVHYKLLNYKQSYLSLGVVYMNVRFRSKLAGDIYFNKLHDFELPVNFNIAINKNILVETGIAFNTSSLKYKGKYGEATLLTLLRVGVKYRIH